MPDNIKERAIVPFNPASNTVLNRDRYNLFAPVADVNKVGMAGFNPIDFEVNTQIVSIKTTFKESIWTAIDTLNADKQDKVDPALDGLGGDNVVQAILAAKQAADDAQGDAAAAVEIAEEAAESAHEAKSIAEGVDAKATQAQADASGALTIANQAKEIAEQAADEAADKYSFPAGGIPKSDLGSGVQALLDKADTALQSETDPTVPSWAKAPQKPSYTKSEVGLGNVDNTSDADKPVSTTQAAAIATKINISDIVNDLVTANANKPLSAAMGKLLNEIASGKTNTFVFSSESEFEMAEHDWGDDAMNPQYYETPLQVGDVALIADIDVPDRWYPGYEPWYPMETTKVDLTGYATETWVNNRVSTLIAGKVDKVAGKGLSENDYTTAEKNKLTGIAIGAQVNVKSDWNAVSGDAEILNKPTIPAEQVNADWNAVSGKAQILNKPTIPSAYTLPTASDTVKGGIKVGAGLQMDGDVLSATGGSGCTNICVEVLGDWS